MSVMNGFDSETGERVFVLGGDNAGFYEDLYATKAWKRFQEEFGFEQNKMRLHEIINQLHGDSGSPLSVSQFVDALNAGMDAGEFTRKVVEQESEAETSAQTDVPLTRAGRPMTDAQQKWSEYRQFSESHSSRECRERARADAGFATFVRKNLEREMQGVGDAVENLNARPESPSGEVTPELRAWVFDYQRTPADKVRQLRRADHNPVGFEEYNRNFDEAVAAGLI